MQWSVIRVSQIEIQKEIQALIKSDEWRFGAANASAQQISDFKIESMARTMKLVAPKLWEILDEWLSINKRRKRAKRIINQVILEVKMKVQVAGSVRPKGWEKATLIQSKISVIFYFFRWFFTD
jgi:hypothetical protein